MYMNPSIAFRQSLSPRRLAILLALSLAACVGGGQMAASSAAMAGAAMAAKAAAPTDASVCHCAHCPGGAACCCHDKACVPH